MFSLWVVTRQGVVLPSGGAGVVVAFVLMAGLFSAAAFDLFKAAQFSFEVVQPEMQVVQPESAMADGSHGDGC